MPGRVKAQRHINLDGEAAAMAYLRLVVDNQASGPTPLARLVGYFMATKHRRAERTKQTYREVLRDFLQFAGHTWPISYDLVLAYLEAVELRTSQVNANKHWRHLRTFLNWAYREKEIETDIAGRIKRDRVAPDYPTRTTPVSFRLVEVEQLLGYLITRTRSGELIDLRDHAFIRFMYVTGCRPGEASAAEWQDLNLGERSALIRAETSKGPNTRTSYYNLATVKALSAWRAALDRSGYDEPYLFTGLKYRRPSGRISPTGLYQAFQRRLAQAGIKPRRLHGLRHSHVQHALARGISPDQVMLQVGHSSLAVTTLYSRSHDVDRQASYADF